MADSPPLIREIDPNIESAMTDAVHLNAGRTEMAHTQKGWTIAALVTSSLGFIFFLASYIIVTEAPFTPWWDWDAGRINIPLSIIMFLSAVFCTLRLAYKVPALLVCIIQALLLAFIIPCLDLAFHDSRFPSSKWCRITGGPIGGGRTGTIYPPRHCKDWKLALSIIMGTAIAFAIIICVMYIGELLYRTHRLVFGSPWKGRNMFTFAVPSGTFKFEVNIGFIRQETVDRRVGEGEASTSSAHGPVYI